MTLPFDPTSIAYYDDNSDAFIASTAEVDMGKLYEPFLEFIPAGGRILDLGCGPQAKTWRALGFENLLALGLHWAQKKALHCGGRVSYKLLFLFNYKWLRG